MKSKKIVFDNKVHVFLVIVQRQVLINCRKHFPHLMLFPVVAENGCRHSSPIPLFHFKIRTCIWETEGEKLLLVLTDTRLKMFLKYVFFHITVNFSETHPNCSYTYFLSLWGIVSIRYSHSLWGNWQCFDQSSAFRRSFVWIWDGKILAFLNLFVWKKRLKKANS